MYQLDWSILWGEGGRLLLSGALVTLELAGGALVLALVLGFLFGVVRWSEIKPLQPVCWFYVEFLRNTPPLVQILFWYFSATVILPTGLLLVLRDYGFQFVAAVFALGLYHSAFVAEIVR
ncbi:MAG: ABC transporter permease subunit, partial [Proteobacteria bacterium]|nr:ABC transporter permease subunit [Pseudomonadota bacterium]